MGRYLLCMKEARHPYHVRTLGLNLYSPEELCYYLYHNTALIGETFFEERLYHFLAEECECSNLAERIRTYYDNNQDQDGALLVLMNGVGYYTDIEINVFYEKLQAIKKMRPLERERERADQLFKRGFLERALDGYTSILSKRRDSLLMPEFYAEVMQHMGAAYMRLGLSAEALESFRASYEEKPSSFVLEQMYYLSLETGEPFAGELEQIDAVQLNTWQNRYMEAQNKGLSVAISEDHQKHLKDSGHARIYLEHEKDHYRRSIT